MVNIRQSNSCMVTYSLFTGKTWVWLVPAVGQTEGKREGSRNGRDEDQRVEKNSIRKWSWKLCGQRIQLFYHFFLLSMSYSGEEIRVSETNTTTTEQGQYLFVALSDLRRESCCFLPTGKTLSKNVERCMTSDPTMEWSCHLEVNCLLISLISHHRMHPFSKSIVPIHSPA